MSNSQANRTRWLSGFPPHTWLGVFILIASEILLIFGLRVVIEWFTPIMWTGYILIMDGWLRKQSGESWLTNRAKEFPLLVLASVGIWVLFEAYNLHLQNWYYLSLPRSEILKTVGYFWSFATIIPGVFLTSQIVEQYFPAQRDQAKADQINGEPHLLFLVGLAMVILPLAVPRSIARYLFGSVWIGFILLVDPINESIEAPSLRAMLGNGRYQRIFALLIGGFICGLLWEAWNFQAFLKGGGHWIYTVPDALRIFDLHYGQMPMLGMLGFPPFALELYAMYHFLRKMLGGERLFGPSFW